MQFFEPCFSIFNDAMRGEVIWAMPERNRFSFWEVFPYDVHRLPLGVSLNLSLILNPKTRQKKTFVKINANANSFTFNINSG